MGEHDDEAEAADPRPTLLDRLAEAGEFVEAGGFSIDAERARDKLRRYQLADPRGWVLLLVEALALAGANSIDFEIDADDVIALAEGVRFAPEELDNLLACLFREASVAEAPDAEALRRARARRQLAFALNSAMALEPRWIELLSPGDPGVRLELRVGEPERFDDETRRHGPVRVHAKDRLRLGHLGELFRALRGTLPEQRLLRERVRWSRIPITLDGEAITEDRRLRLAHDAPALRIEHREGAVVVDLVFLQRDEPGQLQMLCSGVEIETLSPAWVPPGVRALVDGDELRRDVSQTKLLRDANFEAALDSCRAALTRAIAQLLRRQPDLRPDRYYRSWLLHWLAHHRVDAELGLYDALLADSRLARLTRLQLWRDLDNRHYALEDLVGDAPIRWVGERVSLDFDRFWRFRDVLIVDAESRPALDRLLGDRLIDVEDELAEARNRSRRVRELGARHGEDLGTAGYRVRVPLFAAGEAENEGVGGELGLRDIGEGQSWIRVVAWGRVIDEFEGDALLPGVHVVLAGDFDRRGELGAARDDRLAAALLAIWPAMLRLVSALARAEAAADRLGRHELRALHRRWLWSLRRPRVREDMLAQLGFSTAQIDEAIRAAPRWAPLRSLGLGVHPHELPRAGLDPSARIPTWSRAKGGPISLAELAERRQAGEAIHWLDETLHSLPVLDREVLLIEARDLPVLERVFGREHLRAYEERVAWLRRREEFLARAPSREALPELGEAVEVAAGEGLRGRFGVPQNPGAGAAARGEAVEVRIHGRHLCALSFELAGPNSELGLPGPPLVGWIDGEDELVANDDFSGLADLRPLAELVLRGHGAMIACLLDAPPDPLGDRWLLTAAVMVLGGRSGARCLARLRTVGLDADAALARTRAILDLLDELPVHAWRQALDGILADPSAAPSVGGVLERAADTVLQPGLRARTRARLRRELGEALPALLRRPLFEHDGRPWSVEELVVAAARGQLDGTLAPQDAVTREALAALLGPACFGAGVGERETGEEVERAEEEAALAELAAAAAAALEPGRDRGDPDDSGPGEGSGDPIAAFEARGHRLALDDRRALAAQLRARLFDPDTPDPLRERLARLRLFEVDGAWISALQARRERPAELEGEALPLRLAGELELDGVGPARAAAVEVEASDDPGERMLAALRRELRLVRGPRNELLSDTHLDALTLRTPTTRGERRPLFEAGHGLVLIDVEHPLVVASLAACSAEASGDRGWLSLLASATYSFLNQLHAEIEDRHEAQFLALHAAWTLDRAGASPAQAVPRTEP